MGQRSTGSAVFQEETRERFNETDICFKGISGAEGNSKGG